MYVMIIIFLCISHLSIIASEQEPQTPTSPRADNITRPETPSEIHTVTIHQRQSSISRMAAAALSITSATQSRSSISSAEPSSPQSSVELSSTAPLTVRTDSPQHATPIRVSPKNEQEDPNRKLFPAMYLTNFQGKIPVADADDDDGLSCRFYCLCGLCCAGTLVGIVVAIVAAATGGNPFN